MSVVGDMVVLPEDAPLPDRLRQLSEELVALRTRVSELEALIGSPGTAGTKGGAEAGALRRQGQSCKAAEDRPQGELQRPVGLGCGSATAAMTKQLVDGSATQGRAGPDPVQLVAWCTMRNAERTSLFSDMAAVTDLHTGEVISALAAILAWMAESLPRSVRCSE